MTLPLALLLGALLQAPASPADSADAPKRPRAEQGAPAPPPGREPPRAAAPTANDRGRAGRVRPYVTPVYATNYGVGAGGGVAVGGLAGGGSEAALDLRVLTHAQSARATFVTGDPYAERVYGAVVAAASTTDRRQFLGLGPAGLAGGDLFLSHDAASLEARLGVYPLGTTALLVQPSAQFRYDRSGGVAAGDVALSALDPASQAAVRTAQAGRYGLWGGVAVATDLRDSGRYPRSGTFAAVEARRFLALDGSDLQLNQLSGSAALYVPLGGRAAVVVRGVGAVTRSLDGDGDGRSDPIPFVYLPVLDDRLGAPFGPDRLTGRDVVAGGAGVRFPVFDAFGLYGLDATVMGYLGNAYHDGAAQFSPSVSFDDRVALGADGRAPLRPALGLGLSVVDLARERAVVGGAVGLTPAGLAVVSVRLAVDLRDVR